MSKPHISYNWQGRNSLIERIAALAEVDGPRLSRDAFTGSYEFLRQWRQDSPDLILVPLFTALDVVEPDQNRIPLDTFLFEERKAYEKRLKEVDDTEVEELHLAHASVVAVKSCYVVAFDEYRERVEDIRGTFFRVPMDRAEAFGQYLIYEALVHPEEMPHIERPTIQVEEQMPDTGS